MHCTPSPLNASHRASASVQKLGEGTSAGAGLAQQAVMHPRRGGSCSAARSQERFQVGAHDLLYAADPGRGESLGEVEPIGLAVELQRLDGHGQSEAIAVFEAVGLLLLVPARAFARGRLPRSGSGARRGAGQP